MGYSIINRRKRVIKLQRNLWNEMESNIDYEISIEIAKQLMELGAE